MLITVEPMEILDFHEDIKKGLRGQEIFKANYLDKLNIEYKDVTENPVYQKIDVDYVNKIGRSYEVKWTYHDDNIICIEDYTNINIDLGQLSLGWFYKCKADMIIFVSQKTQTMIFLPFNLQFKEMFEARINDYMQKWNRISENKQTNTRWQSAFRIVPLKTIAGYYSIFRPFKTWHKSNQYEPQAELF